MANQTVENVLRFWTAIERKAKQFVIDPITLAALVAQESAGDPLARALISAKSNEEKGAVLNEYKVIKKQDMGAWAKTLLPYIKKKMITAGAVVEAVIQQQEQRKDAKPSD